MLHLCGTEVREGLAEALRGAGFHVLRARRSIAPGRAGASAPARAALRARKVDAVLLFSPRTALIFAELVSGTALSVCLGAAAICLSAAVAQSCRELAWRCVRIAARPDQDALVELLEAADRRC